MANSNGKISIKNVVYGCLVSVGFAFAGYLVWTVYIYNPSCFASKQEVQELRVQRERETAMIQRELKEDIQDLKKGQDKILDIIIRKVGP